MGRQALPGVGLPNPSVAGGSSGIPSTYEASMLAAHQEIMAGATLAAPPGNLVGGVLADVVSGRAANPYTTAPTTSAVGYDPDEALEAFADKASNFLSNVELLDPVADVEDAIQTGINAADFSLLTEEQINASVQKVDERSRASFLRSVSVANAGMFDIGAVLSTQRVQALSAMEVERQLEVDAYEQSLRLQFEQNRPQVAATVAGQVIQARMEQLDSQAEAAGMQQNVAAMTINAKQDELQFNLEMNLRKNLWNLELYHYAGNMLSSVVGSAMIPSDPTWQRVANTMIDWRGLRTSRQQNIGNLFLGAGQMAMGRAELGMARAQNTISFLGTMGGLRTSGASTFLTGLTTIAGLM